MAKRTAPQHAGRARRWSARGLMVTAIAAPALALGLAQAHAADVPAEVEPATTAGTDMVDEFGAGLDPSVDEDADYGYDEDEDYDSEESDDE